MKTDDYIGKTILAAVTYLNATGNVHREEQVHGTIFRIDDEAISFNLANGSGIYTLPPNVDSLFPAERGNYTLNSTAEDISSPDFLACWTVTPNDTEKF